jgi:hypothetical protein
MWPEAIKCTITTQVQYLKMAIPVAQALIRGYIPELRSEQLWRIRPCIDVCEKMRDIEFAMQATLRDCSPWRLLLRLHLPCLLNSVDDNPTLFMVHRSSEPTGCFGQGSHFVLESALPFHFSRLPSTGPPTSSSAPCFQCFQVPSEYVCLATRSYRGQH